MNFTSRLFANRQLLRAMNGDRGRRLLHRLQDVMLRRELAYVAEKSPFYRRKFEEHHINIHDIRQISDLPLLGFFTYPTDLQADPYQFLAIPRREILYAMSSSGTTGKSKIVFLNRSDWSKVIYTVGRGLALMGMTPADVAQIMFCAGNPAWMTGTVLQSGMEFLGAFVLPTGNAASTEKQIEAMRQFGTTALFGTPSYLHRVTEEGAALTDLRSLGIRLIRLGAEPWSEALRTMLQEAWGAEVYDSYGMMELAAVIGGECPAHDGMHVHPYIAIEVVEPQSGRPLPRGELGELVYTTISTQGSPLIRYRSGDLGALMPDEPCACGVVPTDRISRIAGRTDDMLFLGSGENVFPAQIETALLKVQGLTDFQVVIDQQGFRDHLLIRAEATTPSEEVTEEMRQNLYQQLSFLYHDIYESQTILPLEVEFLQQGTLHRESPIKRRRLVDRRGHKSGAPLVPTHLMGGNLTANQGGEKSAIGGTTQVGGGE